MIVNISSFYKTYSTVFLRFLQNTYILQITLLGNDHTVRCGNSIFFLYIKAKHSVNAPGNDNDLAPIKMVFLILTFFEDYFLPMQYLFI
jgi:hypothetical protein